MIFQKLGITRTQLKALIGGIILKFSTAVITCWGNINLYFLSQFHNQGTKITPQTNSFILLFCVPPMVLVMLYANKLCYKYGFEFVIRVCCILFLISPLVTIFVFNIYIFSIFSILIPGTMYALLSIPVLNCIWTQFPQSKNKATSVLVVAFGVGGIVWNFLFMHMINPNNQDTNNLHEEINFFSQAVTKNVRKTAIIGFVITGILALIGSLLIQRRNQENQTLKQEKQEKQDKQDKQQKDNQLQLQSKQQKQTNFSKSQKYMSPTKQPKLKNQLNGQQSEKPTISQNLQVIKNVETLTYNQAIKDQRFIIIMLISILTGLYQIYLMMNFKIIYMPIISDDHFLSYTSMICSVVSIAGAFIWGFLGDYKGIYFTILILSILDLGGKMFSDFAVNKPMIVIMVVLIGLISKSMTTIAGPGFVQIFGLKLGTQLLPLKGVAIILGYVLVPLFQIATAKFLDPHQYLICISFFSVITLICAIRLNMIRWKQLKIEQCMQNDQNQNNIGSQQGNDLNPKASNIQQNNKEIKIEL